VGDKVVEPHPGSSVFHASRELRKIAKPSSQETLSGEPEELPFEGLQMRRVFLVLLIPFLAPVILIAWFLGNF